MELAQEGYTDPLPCGRPPPSSCGSLEPPLRGGAPRFRGRGAVPRSVRTIQQRAPSEAGLSGGCQNHRLWPPRMEATSEKGRVTGSEASRVAARGGAGLRAARDPQPSRGPCSSNRAPAPQNSGLSQLSSCTSGVSTITAVHRIRDSAGTDGRAPWSLCRATTARWHASQYMKCLGKHGIHPKRAGSNFLNIQWCKFKNGKISVPSWTDALLVPTSPRKTKSFPKFPKTMKACMCRYFSQE